MNSASQKRMEQSLAKAHDDMLGAMRIIDSRLGDGYAAKHPSLVTSLMLKANAEDFRWTESEEATIDKAKELGIKTRAGESLKGLQQRIRRAMHEVS